MSEYKLDYTAEEVNQRLGMVLPVIHLTTTIGEGEGAFSADEVKLITEALEKECPAVLHFLHDDVLTGAIYMSVVANWFRFADMDGSAFSATYSTNGDRWELLTDGNTYMAYPK